jgi:DNA-3-methyladenine glycosylase
VSTRVPPTRPSRALPRAFYDRDARDLAPLLLNKVLLRRAGGPGRTRLAARIVEVEAYLGSDDAGSHAFRGRTPRTEVMFGPPGHLYVYFTYGMHWCANVVAGKQGDAAAVLLRAAAPLTGLPAMRAARVKARSDRELCAGPARLCQSFAITGAENGADLVGGPLVIVDDGVPPPSSPAITVRVGLSPGRGDEHPWRFTVPGDPNLSR